MNNYLVGSIFGILYGILFMISSFRENNKDKILIRILKSIICIPIGALFGAITYNSFLVGWFNNQFIAISVSVIGFIALFYETIISD